MKMDGDKFAPSNLQCKNFKDLVSHAVDVQVFFCWGKLVASVMKIHSLDNLLTQTFVLNWIEHTPT